MQGDFYICSMRYVILFFLTLAIACNQADEHTDVQKALTGNWFVLYPEDVLVTDEQEKVYAAIQDSLTGLKCLKLVSFSPNGEFSQLDSIDIKGRWGTKENENVLVYDGGRGFDNFKSTFTGLKDDILQLTEIVNSGGEKIKLIWHLKKIEDGYATQLFTPAMNEWRRKPLKPESDDELKKRLVQVLEYYSIYFQLIADESSYFIPGRVILPVNFYQHGIGLKKFDMESKFTSLFYSSEQAEMAYYILKGAFNRAKFDTPKELKSYSAEYALMLKELARKIAE